ncbi:restriction endonuclease [candidate division KSB1 bacterium 4484_188]|nr:MAG: restriction endonuclease [candidate division KSB1 bacterium 4484_188]
MNDNQKLPAHVRFFLPIIEVLKNLGGSGSPSEIKDGLIELCHLSENELDEKLKTGITRIDNQIIWSKIYLTQAELIDSSNKDLWRLTEKGFKSNLSENDVKKLFKQIHSKFISKGLKKAKKSNVTEIETESEITEIPKHKEELLSILLSLSPEGFERICQRLLRASGFKKVVVTGKSGDGGIDGEGILEINALVSLKVVFQAKRYKDTVSASQIRDFRGAMQGRAEKGIIISTGRFTQDAQKEAIREGVPPIELVDGAKLVELFEQQELGLKRKTIYEIDIDFFEEYR